MPCIVMFIAFALLAWPAQADEALFIRAGTLWLQPSGQIAAGGGGMPGTRINAGGTLGLSRKANADLEFGFQFGDSRFHLAYLPLSFASGGVLPQGFVFQGGTYARGDVFTSTVRWRILEGAYTYYLVNFDDLPSRLQLGVEVALKLTKLRLALEDRTQGFGRTASATLPIPTLGLRGRIALGDLAGVHARVGYLAYGGNHVLDGEAVLEFSPYPAFGAYAGFRYLDVKVDRAGVYAAMRLSGPALGAFLRF